MKNIIGNIPHPLTVGRTIASAVFTALITLSGCKSSSQKEAGNSDAAKNIDTEWLTTEAFVNPSGMSAEHACQLPGLTWKIDTLHGVCVPDTMLILACYEGRLYPTNLRALKGKLFDNLKSSGNDKITKGQSADLGIADFKPKAVIVGTPSGSYEDTKSRLDTAYEAEKTAMVDVAKKFFLTSGSPEYMRRTLAKAWERECQEAEEYGEQANPFNEGYYAKFLPSSIKAEVTDASAGMVEIEAYATDSYTLGYPGTTYWTVVMCKEQDGYKIKELPALHRKFE